MKLSYLLLERNLVLIYWVTNILQSSISLIQSQIHQPVINLQYRLNEMCGSLPSMQNILSQLNACLMKSIAIKLHVENTKSISVYEEGRATREQILKRFVPYLIKSDTWFHILKFYWDSLDLADEVLINCELRNFIMILFYCCNVFNVLWISSVELYSRGLSE